MKQTRLKKLALLAAVLIILALGWVANALVGNPISKLLTQHTAQTYLEETYPDTDFYIDNLNYSFKEVQYLACVKSPSSIDSSFTLSVSMTGELRYDDYSYRVLGRHNTAERLSMAYRELVDSVLDSPSFPYAVRIGFGELRFSSPDHPESQESPNTLPLEQLELDRLYDIPACGAQAGHLTLYVEEDPVSVERAAQIMLDIRDLMERGGVTFSEMDFQLDPVRKEETEGTRGPSVTVLNFPSSDLYEEGLVSRVQAAHDDAMAYYAAQDAQRAADLG